MELLAADRQARGQPGRPTRQADRQGKARKQASKQSKQVSGSTPEMRG